MFAVIPPTTVQLNSPSSPIYATSSYVMSCYFQLHQSLDIPAYFQLNWSTPIGSMQQLSAELISARGVLFHVSTATLTSLSLLDSGKYACSVSVIATDNMFILSSNANMGETNLEVQGKVTA